MKKEIFEKVLFISFLINIVAIIVPIVGFVLIVSIPVEFSAFLNSSKNIGPINTLKLLISIPVIFLWIYNIYFLFKYDHYSKSIFPLIIFNFLYSPYYYYKVKIRKKIFVNNIEPEPVLGNTIRLENYNNDSDYQSDLADLGQSTHNKTESLD
jgi:hypothetical protein